MISIRFIALSVALVCIGSSGLQAADRSDDRLNLARYVDGIPATVSVDSTFQGYSAKVLTDGRWIAPGEETTTDYGSADRLGNSGNTWVSGAVEGVEHWVQLTWPAAVKLNQVEIWWAQDEWRAKAFRVEYLSDQSWVPVTGPESWFEATQRGSVLTFEPVEAQSIRLLQHGRGDGERGLMALQEILVYNRTDARQGVEGARELNTEERRKLAPTELVPNIARLSETQPGASAAVVWSGPVSEASTACASLADGDLTSPAAVPAEAQAAGIEWPVRHVIDSATLYFAGQIPETANVSLTVRNGGEWFPVQTGLQAKAEGEQKRIVFSFEPIACEALACGLSDGASPVAELEVSRYIPEGPNVWRERLTTDNQFEREFLASGQEPSFNSLSGASLSMVPARALLGLKDMPQEIGVTFDGTIIAQETITFDFGPDGMSLVDYRDTVTRKLIDGWRPGTIVEGRIGNLLVKQRAFVSFVDDERKLPALFVRVELRTVDGAQAATPVAVELASKVSNDWGFNDHLLNLGSRLAMAVKGAEATFGTHGRSAELTLTPALPATIDLVYPHGITVTAADAQKLRAADFDEGLARFRAYWDELLAPAAGIDVPEQRVNDMYRAVLTQMFINANGDIMPYGSAPSVYDGNLYGLEEGFAMMALSFLGFHEDAQRYMDATYLTPEFLAKVTEYKVYANRHQQYRNGLQPMYAISAYRLSDDREWIQRHLDLFRTCAEWTLENRRKTMMLEDGEKPLHWGLLPKWSYGGDIAGLQCYALYGNFACWRGMEDTAWLLERLGDTDAAKRYFDEAGKYRVDLDRAYDGNFKPDHKPPFLPLRLYADEPVGNDYYQLFAGVLLDLLPFDVNGHRSAYITDYLEQANLMFCGLPRFRRDVGPGGLDALYSLGYLLTKLHQDKIDEFLMGFYAYLAYNMEHGTFASRETNLLYSSDLHVRSPYRVPDMSDPIPCSAAVALHFLRNMLVTEQLEGPGLPSKELRLMSGVPRKWLESGRKVSFRELPTHFGTVSCEMVSRADENVIEANLTPPTREPWDAIHLRLRHPDGKQIKRMTVNGKPWDRFDAASEFVTLLPGEKQYRIVAEF